MEKYHWLPQDINKIPYKKLQKLLLINKQKNIDKQSKINIEKTKNNMLNKGPRRFTREI